MLATTLTGSPTEAPPLVIAHGLFGSARNWGALAKRLSEGRQVVAVDMRNHGGSFWSDDHSYAAQAEDLAEVIAAHGGRADLLGHSMGGKASMFLALGQPALVDHLIVADIAPAGYAHSQRHLIEAMRRVDASGVSRRGQADAQLAETVDDEGVRAFLLQSLDIRGGRWRLNLDALEAEMDRIIGWPGPGGRFDGKVLMLSGGKSDYLTAAHRDEVKALFPNAKFAKIPGAGHWLHAEKPEETAAAVAAFLAL